jgi:DNA-directed RNA polymerase subunit F
LLTAHICVSSLVQSDNNVKLIVLERLNHLKKTQPRVLRELVMDLLRALSSPNEDIQRKTLDIAMGLVSPRNVEEIMALLKKEIVRTQGADSKANKGYRCVPRAVLLSPARRRRRRRHRLVVVLSLLLHVARLPCCYTDVACDAGVSVSVVLAPQRDADQGHPLVRREVP